MENPKDTFRKQIEKMGFKEHVVASFPYIVEFLHFRGLNSGEQFNIVRAERVGRTLDSERVQQYEEHYRTHEMYKTEEELSQRINFIIKEPHYVLYLRNGPPKQP